MIITEVHGFRLVFVLHLPVLLNYVYYSERVMSVAYLGYHFQSNLSNTDIEGTEQGVRIREVSVQKTSLG